MPLLPPPSNSTSTMRSSSDACASVCSIAALVSSTPLCAGHLVHLAHRGVDLFDRRGLLAALAGRCRPSARWTSGPHSSMASSFCGRLRHQPASRPSPRCPTARSAPSLRSRPGRRDCASRRTSTATTAKPLPASPARAASTEAFSARRLVWKAMSSISPMMLQILPEEVVIRSIAAVGAAASPRRLLRRCASRLPATPARLRGASRVVRHGARQLLHRRRGLLDGRRLLGGAFAEVVGAREDLAGRGLQRRARSRCSWPTISLSLSATALVSSFSRREGALDTCRRPAASGRPGPAPTAPRRSR